MTYFVYWKSGPSAPWTVYECHHGDGDEERAQAEKRAQACISSLWVYGYAVRLEVNP